MDRTKASVGQDGGDTEQVIASELVHLLESPMFVRSPVLSRLLQYLVDHRLQGNRAAPKAYARWAAAPISIPRSTAIRA